MIIGIDVSNHQGVLNWPSLKTSLGLSFAFCKATEGTTFTDSTLAGNWSGIKSAGLVRGAYHFARPERSSAVKQADFFLSRIPNLDSDDKLILDLETTQLSASDTNAWAIVWADRVASKTGRMPWIYTGSYLKNSTGNDFNQHFSAWWFPTYPNKYRPTTTFPNYIISPPSPNIWGRMPDMWQYTDKFHNAYDCSVFDGTVSELRALGGAAERTDDTMAVDPKDVDTIALAAMQKVWNYVVPGQNLSTAVILKHALDQSNYNTQLLRALQDAEDAESEVDVNALAKALAALLPPQLVGSVNPTTLADAVVEQIHARLSD